MDFFPGGESAEVDPIEVSPLANTYLPSQISEATSSRPPGMPPARPVRARDWTENSVLEVYSASKGRWYIGYVLQANAGEFDSQMLTVRFFDENNEAKQKSSPRNDPNLAPVGDNTIGQLPPGFQQTPSQSRPGAFSYLDISTGMKYSSVDLAWNVHFQRLRDGPPMQAAQPQAGQPEEMPVPRQSPAAIAAGLVEDMSPPPKMQSRAASRLSESSNTAFPAAPSAADARWKKAKDEFAANLVSQME